MTVYIVMADDKTHHRVVLEVYTSYDKATDYIDELSSLRHIYDVVYCFFALLVNIVIE